MNPLVSVIIPAYNREGTIRETIDSVLSQTYKDFEVIIIDDGSFDNTKGVIESFSDSRIRYFYQENAGASHARNKGLDLAGGEFIAPLDSDDLWHPEKLQKQVEFLQKFHHIDICGSWGEFIGYINKPFRRPVSSNAIKAAMLFDSPIIHSSALIRKSLFQKTGVKYNQSLRSSLDYDLWTQFIELHQEIEFYNMPEMLVKYRMHENQITTKNRNEQVNNADPIRKRHLAMFGLHLSDEEFKIHSSVCSLIPDDSYKPYEYYKKIDLLLKKIVNTNRNNKKFTNFSLESVICDLWVSLCTKTKENLAFPLLFFLMFPVSFSSKLGVPWERIKDRIGR